MMKAIVRETGMKVDVHQYGFPDTDLWKCDDENMVFHKSALIFMGDMIDWEERRYEIAKELYVHYDTMNAEDCIRSADELIKQLKAK